MSPIYSHWKDDTAITEQNGINRVSSVINNNRSTPQSQPPTAHRKPLKMVEQQILNQKEEMEEMI